MWVTGGPVCIHVVITGCICICCSNLNSAGELLFLLPRFKEMLLCPWEVYKLDLHTPEALCRQGLFLKALTTADCAEIYIDLMQELYSKPLLLETAETSFVPRKQKERLHLSASI